MDISNFLPKENELPLDTLIDGGGLTKIFRTIACIGDSLSSGEFESYNEDYGSGYYDFYDYSWGQYMAREADTTVYNFSRGGMTAKEYMESFAKYSGFWKEDKLCQAYIIALGVNDLIGQKQQLGKVSDADERECDTFASHYGKMIKRIKMIQPEAKVFLMTMPRDENAENNKIKEGHAKLLYDFAEKFKNTYVLDLYKYACCYDKEFRKRFFLGGHMNAQGYILTAKMVMSYIDYIIRHNYEDFVQVPFIGKPYHNANYKR
ncbi:MAG: SGNH/GDSL hydrolase family protein [Oscillospiraceae bacterium]|nr:SGNH/GDSL hydrolase family protein [Oscillospiraceae bacterium]